MSTDLDLSCFTDHTFFRNLCDKDPVKTSKCLDLIAYSNDLLLVWSATDVSLNVINVKHSVRDNDLENFVVLKPSTEPLFTVERVLVNETCTWVALVSGSGICVIQLPEKWNNSKKEIVVPSKPIGQRVFLGEHHQVRHVKWHPGSPSESHLLVLSSDECLRLYDVITSEVVWKYGLSHHSPHQTLPGKVSLGDTPVNFDFAAPILDGDVYTVKWPVLVLWGNGDIHCVLTTLQKDSDKRYLRQTVRMYPHSDDNYGTDASSLLVLDSNPQIVALATCNGTLYHCIILPSADPESKVDISLYVIESIELDIGLAIGEVEDTLSCPIKLMKNPGDKRSYFCIHNAGIHLVSLPFLSKLHEFVESDELDFNPSSVQSTADYLLCTSMTNDICLPILGVCFVDLSSTLFILLNDRKLMNMPIFSTQLNHSCLQDFEVDKKKDDKGEDGFLIMIQNMLKEGGAGNKPVFKLPSKDNQPQEWLEMVLKVTQKYKQTMQGHENIALKIKHKVEALKKSVSSQKNEIVRLEKDKTQLKLKAECLAERYEDINEKQVQLMARAEKLVLKMKYKEPNLTTAEKKMFDTLDNTSTNIEKLEKDVARVRSTYEYQLNISNENSDNIKKKELFISSNKSKLIRQQLKHLNQEIMSLTKRVKDLKNTVSYIEGL